MVWRTCVTMSHPLAVALFSRRGFVAFGQRAPSGGFLICSFERVQLLSVEVRAVLKTHSRQHTLGAHISACNLTGFLTFEEIVRQDAFILKIIALFAALLVCIFLWIPISSRWFLAPVRIEIAAKRRHLRRWATVGGVRAPPPDHVLIPG